MSNFWTNLLQTVTDKNEVINQSELFSSLPQVIDDAATANPFSEGGNDSKEDDKKKSKEFIITVFDEHKNLVLENDSLYITTVPQMPNFVVVLHYDVEKYKSIYVKTTIRFSKSITNNKGVTYTRKTDASFMGNLSTLAVSSVPGMPGMEQIDFRKGGQLYYFNFDKIVGGNAVIEVFADAKMDKALANFKLKIKGDNPTREEIDRYIDEKHYNDTYYFFKAIARHESPRGQFNTKGGSQDGMPIFGGPDGWGCMQIDTQYEASPDLSHLWNWKKNVDKSFEIIKGKVKQTIELLGEQVKRIKEIFAEHPEDVLPADDVTYYSTIFSHVPTNLHELTSFNEYFQGDNTNKKSFIDAFLIRRYNGGQYYLVKSIGDGKFQWYIDEGKNDYVNKVSEFL